MIDLGDELANYEADPPKKPHAAGDNYRPVPGGGTNMLLADMQSQGFNTTPLHGWGRSVNAAMQNISSYEPTLTTSDARSTALGPYTARHIDVTIGDDKETDD